MVHNEAVLEKDSVKLRIGEFLVQQNSCSSVDVQQALEVQNRVGGRLGSILLNVGTITENQLYSALAEQFELLLLHNVDHKLTPFLPNGLTTDFFFKFNLCLVNTEDHANYLVLSDPLNMQAISRIEFVFDEPFKILLASQADVDSLLANLLENDEKDDLGDIVFDGELDKLKELASEAPVIKFVNRVIAKAVDIGASDIHFESFKQQPRVRVRVDGVLMVLESVPSSMQVAIVARLKLISGMNIAENRLPQDGRLSLRVAGKEVDIRASSTPTSFGESFVLRLLLKQNVNYSLGSLGFYPDQLNLIQKMINNPNGVFLTTGPTGSGKTTTLYSVLSELNSEKRKIITVEDPVEYELEGINQIHVHEKIEYTFARALRSILRQDPDIIMIGEIRDRETAEIAIQSALTGHLVLSTLHTNSAISSLTRLLDMGIESFLLKASIVGFMAQRLVRTLCQHCAAPLTDLTILEQYNVSGLLTRHPHIIKAPKIPVGCENCQNSGYKGRVVIAEVIPFEQELKQALDAGDLHDDVGRYGYRSMLEDGLLKVFEGKTSLDEVLQVAG